MLIPSVYPAHKNNTKGCPFTSPCAFFRPCLSLTIVRMTGPSIMAPTISTSAAPPESIVAAAAVALKERLRQTVRRELGGIPLLALANAGPDVVIGPA